MKIYKNILRRDMDDERASKGEQAGASDSGGVNTEAPPQQQPARAGEPRIQFSAGVKPKSKEPVNTNTLSFGVPITKRSHSIVSIPQVVSPEEKNIRQREKEHAKRSVAIDEHLVPHMEVAARYQTKIDLAEPGKSFGLTSEQASELLRHHGANILTPPPKRHPILKYIDCLTSLFNLLLVVAGVLEYILLGINYKANFQNVSSWRYWVETR